MTRQNQKFPMIEATEDQDQVSNVDHLAVDVQIPAELSWPKHSVRFTAEDSYSQARLRSCENQRDREGPIWYVRGQTGMQNDEKNVNIPCCKLERSLNSIKNRLQSPGTATFVAKEGQPAATQRPQAMSKAHSATPSYHQILSTWAPSRRSV